MKTTTTAIDVDGLRHLADMLEDNPELASFVGLESLYVFYVTSAQDLATIARAALRHGATVTKVVSESQHNLSLRWGAVEVLALASRSDVCERILVGTETVIKHVPDPAAVAQIPLVEVTENVEHYEWKCQPLLSALSDEEH